MMEIYKNINEPDWRSQCELLAKQSSMNCGLSHTVFVNKFSDEIDSKLSHLSPEDKVPFLDIAREWDYATPQERYEEQISCKEQGYCSHGIEFGCCPAGCEEYSLVDPVDEYRETIHDLKDKLGVASDQIDSLELENHALEHELIEANQRCKQVQSEFDEAIHLWEHFIDLFEAEKSKVDFYRKHPIKALFGLLPQAIK
jgi:hypothetical protein